MADDQGQVAVEQAIAGEISEGVHACLRKYCDSEASGRAYQAIREMPDGEWSNVAALVAEQIVENCRFADTAPDLLEALVGYMGAVSLMNAAMKDGINVHGAVAGIIGWEDMANAAIAKATGA